MKKLDKNKKLDLSHYYLEAEKEFLDSILENSIKKFKFLKNSLNKKKEINDCEFGFKSIDNCYIDLKYSDTFKDAVSKLLNDLFDTGSAYHYLYHKKPDVIIFNPDIDQDVLYSVSIGDLAKEYIESILYDFEDSAIYKDLKKEDIDLSEQKAKALIEAGKFIQKYVDMAKAKST